MSTSRDEIADWFDWGIEKGASHMIIVCDTFDYDDYPVFVNSVEEARKKVASPGQMQKVMEVYLLSGDKEEQLNQRRCFRYE